MDSGAGASAAQLMIVATCLVGLALDEGTRGQGTDDPTSLDLELYSLDSPLRSPRIKKPRLPGAPPGAKK